MGSGTWLGSSGRAPARRFLAGAAVLAAAAALAGCGGGASTPDPGFTPPGRGQASILLSAGQADSSSGLDLNENRFDDAMAVGPDGSLYLLRTDLYKVSPGRKISRVWRAGPYVAGGLAVLPDGALAVGVPGAVLRISHGKASVLTGDPDPVKGATAAKAPESSTAPHKFSGVARPLGMRPDGALLVRDGAGVWAAKGGAVTSLLKTPGDVTHLPGAPDGAVDVQAASDADGDVYLPSGDQSPQAPTKILRIAADGRSAQLAVPERIAGVPAGTADLAVETMAGDGADGVYAHVLDTSGAKGWREYVLHLYDGKARLVVSRIGAERGLDCAMARPADALKMPCTLPEGMAYRGGKLIMDGSVHYTLEISVG